MLQGSIVCYRKVTIRDGDKKIRLEPHEFQPDLFIIWLGLLSKPYFHLCLDEDIFQHEEDSQYPHGDAQLLDVSAAGVDGHIADHTAENTIRNTVGERHHDDGDESRDRLCIVVQVDVLDRRHHIQTHDDEHRSSCCRRN